MEPTMLKTESYDDRRKLFKDIWQPSVGIEDNETAGTKDKPKIIKTVRLADVKHELGKKKKQHLKNLRTVCNRLLNYCDRKDAEDLLFDQFGAEGKSLLNLRHHKYHIKKGKGKNRRRKSKRMPVHVHHCDMVDLNDGTARNISPLAYAALSQNNFRNTRLGEGKKNGRKLSIFSRQGKFSIVVNRKIEPKKLLQMTKINIF